MSTNTNILIVDDDPNIRKGLSDILRFKGYTPKAVGKAKEALAVIREEVPVVALIDLKLEDMSGLVLMKTIKTYCPATECIVLTGYASQASAIEAVNLGAYGYVQKPYDMNQLLMTLRRAIEKQQAEEALRMSREEFRRVINSISDHIYVTRVSEKGEHTNLYISPNVEALTGYAPEKFMADWGFWLSTVIRPDDRHAAAAQLAQLIRGQNSEAEYRLVRPDGEAIWVRDSARVESEGQSKVIYGVVSNITARKQAEAEVLRQRDRAKALADASRVFAQAGQDLASLLDAVIRRIAEHLGDVCIVTLLSEDRQWLEPAAWYHPNPDAAAMLDDILASTPYRLDEGLDSRVVKSGEPLYIPVVRPEQIHDWVRPEQGSFIERFGVHSLLIVPLQVQERVIGTVSLGRNKTRPAYTGDDQILLADLANRAGMAIRNMQLLEAVGKHSRNLQRLSTQLIKAQEAERKRISRELHDEMGQALTAISINLAAIKKELPPDLAAKTGKRLAETSLLAGQILEQVREMSFDLRPNMLDVLGLVPTLRWYVNRYSARLNLKVEFEVIGFDEQRLSPEVETTLYRIVQESLTNVARYARAGRVRLHLQFKDSTISALIADDGRGFDVEELSRRETTQHGMGLLGIQERAAALRGRVTIQSRPGEGTRLFVEVPWEDQ